MTRKPPNSTITVSLLDSAVCSTEIVITCEDLDEEWRIQFGGCCESLPEAISVQAQPARMQGTAESSLTRRANRAGRSGNEDFDAKSLEADGTKF